MSGKDRANSARDEVYIADALENLAAAFPENRRKFPSAADPSLPDDPLFAVCQMVASSQGIRLTRPAYPQAGGGDPVEEIARASRVPMRRVRLQSGWHRQNGGSLLGYMRDSGKPVALIQSAPRVYRLHSAAGGAGKQIDRRLAERIEPLAIMFYRTLPQTPQRPWDIVRFTLRGVPASDWLWVLATGFGGGLLGILFAQIAGWTVDRVLPTGNRLLLVQIGALLVALAVTAFLLHLVRSFAARRIAAAAERDLPPAVWDRLLSLPAQFFRDHTAGELAGRVMSASRVRAALSASLTGIVIASVTAAVCLVFLFAKSANLALAGLAVLLPAQLVSLLLGLLRLRHESRGTDRSNQITGRIHSWLHGLSKIRTSAAEARIFWNWSGPYAELRRDILRHEGIGSGIQVIQTAVPLVTLLLVYPAFSQMGGELSVGDLIACAIALQKLAEAGRDLTAAVLRVGESVTRYKDLTPILEAEPESAAYTEDPGVLGGLVELRNVTFRYRDGASPALDGVSLRVEPGEHVAIVGPSGSGKSTLIRLLLGFETPETGDVLYDDKRLAHLDPRLVRRQLGVVLQGDHPAAGSIFENIVGHSAALTREDTEKALEIAGLTEDIEALPMGLATVLGDRAPSLSSGQRQQLMIARAVAEKPKILLFDEATSSLDNPLQRRIDHNIAALGVTRVTVAHRLSAVQNCDRIVVLVDGRIVEQGTYRQLLQEGGEFSKMAAWQVLEPRE